MELLAPLFDARPAHRCVEIGGSISGPDPLATLAILAESIDRIDARHARVEDPIELIALLEEVDQPVDVVVDHASEDVDDHLRLFEVAFARLAPGGIHIIDRPLPAPIVVELMLLSAVRPELVEGVTATPTMVVVHRGRWPSEHQSLVLGELRTDPFGVVPR